MLKVIQVPFRSSQFCRLLSVSVQPIISRSDTKLAHTGLTVSVSGNILIHEPSHSTRSMYRFYSVRRGAKNNRRENSITSHISGEFTTIDPGKEEEFVFPEFSEPVKQEDLEDVFQKQLEMELTSATTRDEERASSEAVDIKPKKGLDQQLRALNARTKDQKKVNQEHIEFHDLHFPLDESIVRSKRKKKKGMNDDLKFYGTPDISEPVSDTCCSGCGALLHCTALHVPGYLPSEKYKALLEQEKLKNAVCQRCYLLTNHQKALTLTMSKDEYREVVCGIKSKKALVLLIVDLMDVPDSIIPDLLSLVGENKHIVVLGNKIDLLPRDSNNYLQRIKRQLAQYCADAGLKDNVQDIHLISAKTGYGIENFISSLQRSWKYKGDVYLVGTANAGKSTLFNTLVDSDYCKSKGSDVISKATISPWPGTTLNLLKFPIINPTPYRMFCRVERLKMAAQQSEEDLSPEELKRLQNLSKQGYLVGRIGRTFRVNTASTPKELDFDPDSLALEDYTKEVKAAPFQESSPSIDFTHNELKDAHWFFDTPGIMKDDDVLNLLREQEVRLVVPTQAIVPRTFVLKPGMALFLGALGRIDYVEGENSCWFTVIASNRLPLHITTLEKADAIYQKHAGHTLLGVPMGGEERMKDFPALVPREIRLQGRGQLTAVADIKMSSAGWVAVTGQEGDGMVLLAHAPAGAGLSLRTPPLLPHIVCVKGPRLKKSAAYKPLKPPGLVDTTLSHRGAERLKVMRS